jgi:hypothetical protein
MKEIKREGKKVRKKENTKRKQDSRPGEKNNAVIKETMEYSKVNSGPDRTEIPRLLWKPKVQYRVHNSPPLHRVQSQVNPTHSRQKRINNEINK